MIYFVRHGQTDWNLAHKVQGRADIELNETGIAQAKKAKEELKNIQFHKVFCSPLKRTRKTCEIITDEPIVFDDRLLERELGEFEGLKREEFDIMSFWNSNSSQMFIKAETLKELEFRVNNFLDNIIKKYYGKNILVVSHGGVGIFFHNYFYGAPEDGNYLQYLSDNGVALLFDETKINRNI